MSERTYLPESLCGKMYAEILTSFNTLCRLQILSIDFLQHEAILFSEDKKSLKNPVR